VNNDALLMRQVDAGHDVGRTDAQPQALTETLGRDASTVVQRPFPCGDTETAADHVAGLRAAQPTRRRLSGGSGRPNTSQSGRRG
jgi:hypothetical protein